MGLGKKGCPHFAVWIANGQWYITYMPRVWRMVVLPDVSSFVRGMELDGVHQVFHVYEAANGPVHMFPCPAETRVSALKDLVHIGGAVL